MGKYDRITSHGNRVTSPLRSSIARNVVTPGHSASRVVSGAPLHGRTSYVGTVGTHSRSRSPVRTVGTNNHTVRRVNSPTRTYVDQPTTVVRDASPIVRTVDSRLPAQRSTRVVS